MTPDIVNGGAAVSDNWWLQWSNLVLLTFLTTLGILARFAHQAAADGKIEWRRFGVAILTAPALGLMVGGLASWLNANIVITAGIASFVGFAGPAFVQVVATKFIDMWITKKKDAEA